MARASMWWNFVSSRRERITEAASEWSAHQTPRIEGEKDWGAAAEVPAALAGRKQQPRNEGLPSRSRLPRPVRMGVCSMRTASRASASRPNASRIVGATWELVTGVFDRARGQARVRDDQADVGVDYAEAAVLGVFLRRGRVDGAVLGLHERDRACGCRSADR